MLPKERSPKVFRFVFGILSSLSRAKRIALNSVWKPTGKRFINSFTESRRGIEPRSFRLPAYRLTARPNRLSTPKQSFNTSIYTYVMPTWHNVDINRNVERRHWADQQRFRPVFGILLPQTIICLNNLDTIDWSVTVVLSWTSDCFTSLCVCVCEKVKNNLCKPIMKETVTSLCRILCVDLSFRRYSESD